MKKPKVIHIRGTIINDSDRSIYEDHGISYTSPSDIKLPSQREDIRVIINSQGGSVFAGSEIYTMLREYKGHVTVDIWSIAASIASVIAMAGDTVRISPIAQIMIHEASTTTTGDTESHKGSINVLDKINHSIITAYQRKTGLSREKLRQMMAEETWMTAQQALTDGFVDEIMFVDKDNNPLMEARNTSRYAKPTSVSETAYSNQGKQGFAKFFENTKNSSGSNYETKNGFTKFFKR